jgi:hypothetical protein
MATAVEEVGRSLGTEPKSSILKAAVLFRSWTYAHEGEGGLQAEKLAESIQALQPGESTAFYIRAQNAGLILTLPELGARGSHEHEPGSVILSVFAPSQASGTVMGAEGPICAGFPGLSYHLPRSSLLDLGSYAMADQLVSFSKYSHSLAMAVAFKAAQGHVETRDVADPFFISQWLPVALKSPDLCFHYKPVTKKVRDQVVIGPSTLPFHRSGLWMTAKVALHLVLRNADAEGAEEVQGNIIYKLILLKLMLNCGGAWTKDLEAEEGMEVMAKIVRRLLKLRKYIDANLDSIKNKVGLAYLMYHPFYLIKETYFLFFHKRLLLLSLICSHRYCRHILGPSKQKPSPLFPTFESHWTVNGSQSSVLSPRPPS